MEINQIRHEELFSWVVEQNQISIYTRNSSGNIIDTYQRRLCLGFLSDRWATQVPTLNDIL